MEAPPGFEPGMEVLQTSALPLGDGAVRAQNARAALDGPAAATLTAARATAGSPAEGRNSGAGNGIRTRDFDLGKVALYH